MYFNAIVSVTQHFTVGFCLCIDRYLLFISSKRIQCEDIVIL